MPEPAALYAASVVVKLTVALPADAVEAIVGLAARAGKTKTQILREAIALKRFAWAEGVDCGWARLLLYRVSRPASLRAVVFR